MGHCRRADIEEFPLEGVRTIAGSIHKHYFSHLPPGLQRIDFGHNFNQSILEVDFPKSLQVLIFGNTFNQSLEHVVLPNNLQTLIFGHFGGSFRMKVFFCIFFLGGSMVVLGIDKRYSPWHICRMNQDNTRCVINFFIRGGNISHLWKRKIMCQAMFFKGVTCVPCRVSVSFIRRFSLKNGEGFFNL